MYHTQEKRYQQLNSPIVCERKDAWLGRGCYFWYKEEDAINWGHSAKKKTGKFEIYEADVEDEKFLNTVFNEVHYNFFEQQIEKAALAIVKKTGLKPTVEDICEYMNEKALWSQKLDGILFQDLPNGSNIMISNFPYRKRIQAVVYKTKCIMSFRLKDEYKCI